MDFGTLNEHTVGFLMLEWVLRAIHIIRRERFAFEVTQKEDITGKMNDLVTSVDKSVQQMYVDNIRASFPTAGILAEESDDGTLPPINPQELYFTIDPLDGTRALVRQQSHGIATMIAMVKKRRVVAAFVGDVMAGDVYGFQPGAKNVLRYNDAGAKEPLLFPPFKFSEHYVLLRQAVSLAPPIIQEIVKPHSQNGIFGGQTIDSGSVGAWIARLWKGEYAAAIIPPTWETPWDNSPLLGISKRMGFELLSCNENGSITDEPYTLPTMSYRREHYQIMIHKRDKAAFLKRVAETVNL